MIEMLLVGAIVARGHVLFDVGADAGAGPAAPGTATAGADRGGLVPRLDRSPDPCRSLRSGSFRRALRRVQLGSHHRRRLPLSAARLKAWAAAVGLRRNCGCAASPSVITCSPAMAGCGQIRAVVRGPWGVPPGSHAATHWEFDHDACPPRVCTVPASRPGGLFPGLGDALDRGRRGRGGGTCGRTLPRPRRVRSRRSRTRSASSATTTPSTSPMPAASIAVMAAQYGAGAHKRVDCVECHTDALTTKHPRNEPRQGDVRAVPRVPRGRDHTVQGQRARPGEGRRASDLPGLPRQRAYDAAQQGPERADVRGQPVEDLRQVPRRSHGGLPRQRARHGADQVGPDRGGAVLQRLPRHAQHRQARGREGAACGT